MSAVRGRARTSERGADRRSTPSLADRLARRFMLEAARRIQVGRLTIVPPDGPSMVVGDQDPAAEPRAEIHVRDEAGAWRMLVRGEIGAGEAYMDGLWSSPDLPALLRLAARNRETLALSEGWWRTLVRLPLVVAHRARRNTPAGSSRNIRRHYDLGNDFYRLFLDDSMTYSSAVFESGTETLAEAQQAKYRAIADRAGLVPGMRVLEIGSGWGGFARYAAGDRGCDVTSITISPAQHELASERIRQAGLRDRARIELRDYRDVHGTYDAIVSIEMLEAVGHEYFPAFFGAVDRALVPGGRCSLQVITFPDASYDGQRRGVNWIQTHIFPGGLLPSLAVIERATASTRLLITDVRDIAPSYVRTLAAWRTAFEANLDAVRALGFDERFIRMWEYYLHSEAGFATGITQDLQIVLEKSRGLPR